ncbi:MAG: hypothetical protein P4L99_21160 [Chthoniobacter sp.]|nr:hypothetical protein [Chthoniobacter sp.]
MLAVLYAAAPLEPWFDRILPPGGSRAHLVQKLASPEPNTVMTGLYFLTKRADPVAVPRALELLQSPDDYLWLNAAFYLGACRRPEAVPYLIKALRHTASRSDVETTGYLRAITGQDFGPSFAQWQQWWLAEHPGFQFDWDSHLGPIPRLAKAH